MQFWLSAVRLLKSQDLLFDRVESIKNIQVAGIINVQYTRKGESDKILYLPFLWWWKIRGKNEFDYLQPVGNHE